MPNGSFGMMDDMRMANPPPVMTFLEGILGQVAGASNAVWGRFGGFFAAGYRLPEAVEFRTAGRAQRRRDRPGRRRRVALRP